MSISNDKMIQFVKRWREIERQTKDLDFQRSVFARDLRKEFEHGKYGDSKFEKWCEVELGLNATGACELLTRARAVDVCKDEKTYTQVGGFKSVRHAIGLGAREQVAVLEAAKVQNKNVRTVIREREATRAANAPVIPSTKPVMRYSSFTDAKTLAAYIHRTSAAKNLPPAIREIIARYLESETSKTQSPQAA